MSIDKEVIDIFEQYGQEAVMKNVLASIKERGYKEVEVDVNGLWEEIFCQMVDEDFADLVVDSIENSIGLESYGFVASEEED